MARASSSYRLHAIFRLSLLCSMPSSPLSLHFPFSRPSAIPAAIGDSPPMAELSEAEPADRSKAHISSGRVQTVPPRENHTGGMAILTADFSFQAIPYPSSSSYFPWTVSPLHGPNLGLLPAFRDSITVDRRSVAVEFGTETDNGGSMLNGIGVKSTECTEMTSASKDLSSSADSVLLLPGVPYTSPRVDYNDSLWTYFSALKEETAVELEPSNGSVENNVEHHNLASSRTKRRRERVPRRGINYTLLHQPTGARRLLPGRHDRRATRKRHAVIHGQVPAPWSKRVPVAAPALAVFICAAAGLLLCCLHGKRPAQSTAATELEDDGEEVLWEPENLRGLGPREFVHAELAAATGNFAEERRIGRGGFGPVYRGCLSEEDRHVAIKVLSQDELSVQGLREFQAEVTIMSWLRHRNVVRLVGWCGRRRRLALVYELVPGGSLDTHLYHPDRRLAWPQRYKIALQLGSALRYLHTDCHRCVVHGDIKPANIMLDASLDVKLGDFGLARLVDHGAEPQTTQVVAGTVGYIDPEFVSSRRPSAESDVYSFGVVLLEVACGRRPTTRSTRPDQGASAALLASVRDMHRRNVILEAADRRLDGEFDRMQMERLLVTGLWCAHHDPVQRPSVTQAVDVLRSDAAELPLVGTTGGSVEIRSWEGRAYGDLSAESSSYLDASTETGYLTTEESAYQFPEER